MLLLIFIIINIRVGALWVTVYHLGYIQLPHYLCNNAQEARLAMPLGKKKNILFSFDNLLTLLQNVNILKGAIINVQLEESYTEKNDVI